MYSKCFVYKHLCRYLGFLNPLRLHEELKELMATADMVGPGTNTAGREGGKERKKGMGR